VPTTRKPATQEAVRRNNLGILLQHLHASGPLTRAQLTHRIGLNRSTIAGLVAELTALGAVVEERHAGSRSGVGRPSLVVSPDPAVHVVAVELQVDRLDTAVVAMAGSVVGHRHERLRPGQASPEVLAGLVAQAVQRELARLPRTAIVVGCGVSMPAVIRQPDGLVRFAPNLGWTDEPFGDLVRSLLPQLPVRFGNDGDLGALAEHHRGAAVGIDDLVFVSGEVGVGGGLILGGRPVTGAGGYAGELGHMTIRPTGRTCRCGARGCWETEIGAGAIARALGCPEATVDDLVAQLRGAGRSPALDEVGRYLGIGLASIVNLVNPRLIVLGGLLREVYPATGEVVQQALRRGALRAPAGQVRVEVPKLGGNAVLLGAAEMAWQHLLDDPARTLAGARALRSTLVLPGSHVTISG
jgi:predicted NBD/HSP70 family sugar kinase